jgi:hypothetical protein
MSPDIDALLEQACRDPDPFWQLVDALRAAAEHDPGVLAGWARAANKVARRAAAALRRSRPLPASRSRTCGRSWPTLARPFRIGRWPWPSNGCGCRPNTRQAAIWVAQKYAGGGARVLTREEKRLK